jgi:hypothetical protein
MAKEYDKFRNVGLAEPMDFGSAFFTEAGLRLQSAFGYKNPWGFTDMDCMTERNGYMLLMELKAPPVDILQRGLISQKKAIEGHTRRTPGSLGVVVWGDKGLDNIVAYRLCYNGVWEDIVSHNCRDMLLLRLESWGQYITELGALKRWETKWYPPRR